MKQNASLNGLQLNIRKRISTKHLKNQSLLLPVHKTLWRNHDIVVDVGNVVQRNTAAHGK